MYNICFYDFKILLSLALNHEIHCLVFNGQIFVFVFLAMSSFREKRDIKETANKFLSYFNDGMDETLGVGHTCGAIGMKADDQCTEITDCKCDSYVCKCTLSWWFILTIVLVSALVIGGITCCILRALGYCKRRSYKLENFRDSVF